MMFLLRLVEVFFIVLYLGFLITQIFIPLARSLPLFPLFRKAPPIDVRIVGDESDKETEPPTKIKKEKRNV